MTQANPQFYVVGGTVNPDSPSYVVRRADQELYDRVLAGDFCYVLTSRQMGKSSLMARTARRLTEEAKIHTAIVDLTQIGTQRDKLSAEQWYYGIAHRVIRELKGREVGLRDVNLTEWWQSRSSLSGLQRLTEFFRDLLLEQIAGQIVIFIDEIDSTISLPFTDDFFAAIRACHNARATDAAYNRLSFVLLGVASPSDLVKDATRTPFNVGQRIELTDFTAEEAKPLAAGLSENSQDGEQIISLILDWTNGHPYLTQRLCQIGAQIKIDRTKEQIDQLVEETFPVMKGPPEDSNLSFVYDRLIKEPRLRINLLNLYRLILEGQTVPDMPHSIVQTELKLSGIVKRFPDRKLRVRNRIYARVFNEAWAKETIELARNAIPTVWKQALQGIFKSLALFVIASVLAINLMRSKERIPPGSPSESFLAWTAQIVRYSIFWAANDVLALIAGILHWWIEIRNPIIGLGLLLMTMTVTLNLFWFWRAQIKKKRWKGQIASFAINCPTCGQNAPPIPGTEDRYRCNNGHLFSGVYHGW